MRTIMEVRRLGVALTVFTLVGGGLLFGPAAASAQTCIQDVWAAHGNNQNLQCTANDVTLSVAENINITAGGQCVIENGVRVCRCFAGGTVTFTADFRMDLTADARYDVGFYIETEPDSSNDGALTGTCTATASLVTNTDAGNFTNLDAAPDVCGDITGPLGTAHNPLFVEATITTDCPTAAGEQLELPFCTTWRQPGSNEVCLGTGNGSTTNDVYPGSPSKCNCGTLAIDIFSAPTDITVVKDAITTSVPETGGPATYNVKVINNSTTLPVTLTSLTDDKYGDITMVDDPPTPPLSVTATTCVPDGNPATCEVGGTIAAGGQCSCTFTGTVPPGDTNGPGFADIVTACATNPSNPTAVCRFDDALVPYSDVPQAPSLVKTVANTQCEIDVTYNVVVTNNVGSDPSPGLLTLNSLIDDKYGNITLAHPADQFVGQVVSTTCSVPQTIQPGANYPCSFVGRMTSCNQSLTDIVTGGATDDDGQVYPTTGVPFTGTATVTVTVTPPPL